MEKLRKSPRANQRFKQFEQFSTIDISQLEQTDSSPTSSDDEDHKENQTRKRTRRKRPIPSKWKRVENKANRELGGNYLGVKSQRVEANGHEKVQFLQNVPRNARQIGERCPGHATKDGIEGYRCAEVTEDQRITLFTNFWKQMCWRERKIYVTSLVEIVEPSRRTSPETFSRICNAFKYYLSIDSKRIRVCKILFCSTFSLSSATVFRWRRNVHGMTIATNTNLWQARESVKSFFGELPKLPSHYCRSSSTKNYLETSVNSKQHLFEIYSRYCDGKAFLKASRWTFNDEFDIQNLAIYQPKKDQCNICISFANNSTEQSVFNCHIANKIKSLAQKTTCKRLAIRGKLHALTVDVQGLQQAPRLKVQAAYFKSKLNLHNYSVFDIGSKHCCCYWWHECNGEINASTITSCLVDYIYENCLNDRLPIVIFSDGCAYQNRNSILSNALLNISVKNKKIITQSYLEKGHTYMECDSVHSRIEEKVKHRDMFLPSEYSTVTAEARKNPGPYCSKLLDVNFFKNFGDKSFWRYDSIRPGNKAGDPQVIDVKSLQYRPNGKIFYKLDYSDKWTELPRKAKLMDSSFEYSRLYETQIPLPGNKWKDLQDLAKFIPEDCRLFYHSLPFK